MHSKVKSCIPPGLHRSWCSLCRWSSDVTVTGSRVVSHSNRVARVLISSSSHVRPLAGPFLAGSSLGCLVLQMLAASLCPLWQCRFVAAAFLVYDQHCTMLPVRSCLRMLQVGAGDPTVSSQGLQVCNCCVVCSMLLAVCQGRVECCCCGHGWLMMSVAEAIS